MVHEKALLREAMHGMLPKKFACARKLRSSVISSSILSRARNGNQLPLPEPHAELRQFVDWERVSATVATAAGSTLWVGLRSVSLCYWLNAKGVKKKKKEKKTKGKNKGRCKRGVDSIECPMEP